MRVVSCFLLGALLAGWLVAQTPLTPGKTHLATGDMAPDFTLPATTGQNITLSGFRGKKNVVLAFFPAAFTGGCTKQLTAYQAGIGGFDAEETQVIGISTDNLPTLRHWTEEHLKAAFPLASDFMRKVAADYGVLVPERGIASRTTFVVDKGGRIRHIEEGAGAIDPSGALQACKRVR